MKLLIREQYYAFSEETFIELTDVLMRNKFDQFISASKRAEILKLLANRAEWFSQPKNPQIAETPRTTSF